MELMKIFNTGTNQDILTRDGNIAAALKVCAPIRVAFDSVTAPFEELTAQAQGAKIATATQ